MSRVTESSTCLTSAQVLCDRSWHWEQPGWILGGIAAWLTERQESALSRWNANWLYRDTNPSTNSTLHYIVILLFQDNGETIKQLVQLFRSPEQSPAKESQTLTCWRFAFHGASPSHSSGSLCASLNIQFVIHRTTVGFSLPLDQR